jgi:hypothetical protein
LRPSAETVSQAGSSSAGTDEHGEAVPSRFAAWAQPAKATPPDAGSRVKATIASEPMPPT